MVPATTNAAAVMMRPVEDAAHDACPEMKQDARAGLLLALQRRKAARDRAAERSSMGRKSEVSGAGVSRGQGPLSAHPTGERLARVSGCETLMRGCRGAQSLTPGFSGAAGPLSGVQRQRLCRTQTQRVCISAPFGPSAPLIGRDKPQTVCYISTTMGCRFCHAKPRPL